MNAFWITVIASVLPFWLLQNIIHELSHGLTACVGWKWKFSIYPFPSMKLGRFSFAHCLYFPDANSKTFSKKGFGIISIMPKIVNIIFMIMCAFVGIIYPDNQIVLALMAVFSCCNFIDFVFGMSSVFRLTPNKSDLWRFIESFNLNICFARVVTALSMILFLIFPGILIILNFAK